MNKSNQTTKNDVWHLIDKEKQRDKQLRIISRISWAITLGVLLIFTYLTMYEFNKMLSLYRSGFINYSSLIDTLVPFLATLGGLSLIIAILVTIGRFMRLRTTNLLEVQQRLASLEQLMKSDA